MAVGISLRPQHLKRYRDIARLLRKYGRSDLVNEAGLGAALEPGDAADDEPPAEAEELAADLEELGPTYIKLGQLMSTRADLIPAAYVKALARLQDDVEPFPFADVERIVEDELGVRMSDAFTDFEYIPLASASLGQVHRATMRDGRQVAVKVQRPDIADRINDDLDALGEVAAFLDRRTEWGQRYGFADMLAEFRRSLLRELDYRIEARNLDTLRTNLARFSRIHVPEPVWDFTSTRVLTMSYIAGRKITDLGPLGRLELDGAELAGQLFEAYLQQILEDGFFHADPHPGNVFITDDGDLALIDLGMVATVDPAMQDHLVKLLLAIGEGKGREVADVAIDMGTPLDDFDRDRFTREVTTLVADQQGVALGDINAGALVADLTRICGERGLRAPPELTMVGKALLNLDEAGRVLDANFDPNAAIQEQAARLLRGRILRSATPGNIFSAALEAKEFAERFPGRVNKVMDALAEGKLTLQIQGIDEHELLRAVQKVANRIAMAVVIAALVVGASMLMRIRTSAELFGYPAIAIVCFMAAFLCGLGLVVTIILNDIRRKG